MQTNYIPHLDDSINQLRIKTSQIVSEHIIPNEAALGKRDDESMKIRADIRAIVRDNGLWAPHLPVEYGGMGIGFLQHAYMNEIMAWSPYSARLFGVVAPNSGNQKVLLRYGTEEQKQKWLIPLIEGKIESCFSMTERHHAGSDPSLIQTTAKRDGDDWVIEGHKWFTSNARKAHFAIVVARTKREDDTYTLSQFIVPTDSEGFEIVRDVSAWGHAGSNHAEIKYNKVRVPDANKLGREGSGHEASQHRLGAGRVFHCMNSIGQMWRAFDLMCKRAKERKVRDGYLADKQFIQGFIADSYNDIQSSRLMTINTAEQIESGLNAKVMISALKIFVPAALHRVVDRSIQVHGAAGVSSDFPLFGMYLGARNLRLADGADEVHKIVIAKSIMRHYATDTDTSWDFATM